MQKRVVYVELDARQSDAIGGEALFAGRELVGVVISGAYGHRVGKSLGFALLDATEISAGRTLEAEIVGERRNVRIIDEPAFDASNIAPRA